MNVRARVVVPAGLVCLLAALLLARFGVGLGREAKLPALGSVPHFELTDQSGRPFDSDSLSGQVWVADFIYTTCPGPCPMMSSKMNRLQASTTNLKMVSFTVDPDHDTPAALTEYARHFKADTARWRFLTGDRSRLNALGVDTFRLNSVDGSLVHSTRFALVDRHGRIRGYYSSEEDGFLPRLLGDVRKLEKET